MARDLPDLSGLSGDIAVRVTPGAARDRIVVEDGALLRVYVTAIAEGGRANAAVQALLARAMGRPKTALRLIRGTGARNKVFRLD